MALWWSVLAGGTLLVTLSGAATKARASRGRRIPRLGLLPPRHTRPSTGALAGLFIGIFSMTLGAMRLSETDGRYFAYFGGAAAVALLAQAVMAWRHNRRLPSPSPQGPLAEDGLRSR